VKKLQANGIKETKEVSHIWNRKQTNKNKQ
jgi:hypothetical protein